MKILKFGGSSLATPDNVRRAIAIVDRAAKESPVRSVVTAVVVSAFGGVTDDLDAAAAAAARHDAGYREAAPRSAPATSTRSASSPRRAAGDTRRRDRASASRPRRPAPRRLPAARVRARGPSTASSPTASGCRPRWSRRALRAAGIAAEAVDARKLIVTDDDFGNARVDLEASFAAGSARQLERSPAARRAGGHRLPRRHRPTARPPPSAAAAPTTRRRSSARRSRPTRSSCGPTSTG